jgi:hypothetical protein
MEPRLAGLAVISNRFHQFTVDQIMIYVLSLSWVRYELGLMRHACLLVSDDGQGHVEQRDPRGQSETGGFS